MVNAVRDVGIALGESLPEGTVISKRKLSSFLKSFECEFVSWTVEFTLTKSHIS